MRRGAGGTAGGAGGGGGGALQRLVKQQHESYQQRAAGGAAAGRGRKGAARGAGAGLKGWMWCGVYLLLLVGAVSFGFWVGRQRHDRICSQAAAQYRRVVQQAATTTGIGATDGGAGGRGRGRGRGKDKAGPPPIAAGLPVMTGMDAEEGTATAAGGDVAGVGDTGAGTATPTQVTMGMEKLQQVCVKEERGIWDAAWDAVEAQRERRSCRGEERAGVVTHRNVAPLKDMPGLLQTRFGDVRYPNGLLGGNVISSLPAHSAIARCNHTISQTMSSRDSCVVLATERQQHFRSDVDPTRSAHNGYKAPTVYRVRGERKISIFNKPTNQLARGVQRQSLNRLFSGMAHVEQLLMEKLSNVARGQDVTVMCVNEGMLDLMLNYICSAKRAGIDLSHVLVFTPSQAVSDLLEETGVHAFYHDSFGNFPSKAAGAYGDQIFVQMMAYKVVSVYLVLRHGYNVLFQDVDIVWFKDPFEFFHAREDVDAFFMDDGARSFRYAPYYINSGFYYLRYNPRTMRLMHRFLLWGDKLQIAHSHQEEMTKLLQEEFAAASLSIEILDHTIFPQGKVYHHMKPTMNAILDGRIKPYMFHMCWTLNKVEKLKYLKGMKMWYLKDQCTEDSLRKYANSDNAQGGGGTALSIPACCNMEPGLFEVDHGR